MTIKRGRWTYVEINCEDCGVELTRRMDFYRRVERNNQPHLCKKCNGSRQGGREVHGYYGTPTYISWVKMKDRCHNPNHKYYHYYGGKGIYVCDEWKTDFESFLKDMGERPGIDYSIDRIDPSQPYTKDNCRWLLKTENTARAAKK